MTAGYPKGLEYNWFEGFSESFGSTLPWFDRLSLLGVWGHRHYPLIDPITEGLLCDAFEPVFHKLPRYRALRRLLQFL
jgi:hypothetical protein